ncbi:MAG: ATP-binding cassette domain-containing protein [Sterolibacteriaceae bacterium MAG5]|nr:ATP-binding cassette domain-containing protein [Candidatus Nitricoxidireducens bremensis]
MSSFLNDMLAGAREMTGGPLRDVFRSTDLRRVMPGLLLAALLYNVLGLALPMAILQIMDRVVVNQSLETLVLLVIGVLAGLILEELLRAVNGLVTGWLGARFEHTASINALTRLMRVPLRRLQRDEPGVHAERINAAGRVADFYSGQALLVLFDLPFALVFLLMIHVIGGWVVLVPIVLLSAFALVIARFGSWLKRQVEQRHIMDDRRINFLIEVLSGIHSVKTMTMESQMERRYERLQATNAEMSERLAYGSAMASATGMLFSQIMVVGVVFAGAWAVLDGQMTPGGLAACMMLAVRALQPLRRSLTVWLRYQAFVSAQARLREVAEMPCIDDRAMPAMPPLREGLELRGVTLSREGGKPFFDNVSLQVKAGECIAIRGDSGSGKTSLLSLMNGLERPESGAVLADGHSLDEFNADSVQRQIALLPQTGTIITGSILENMTMFDESLNAVVLDIAKQMGLDRVVAGMKLGYETRLGEANAETLPAGVRQLISIVRELAHSPSVILFDEANISLDMAADQLLRDYLATRKGECTMVLVTHRPSLLSLADRTLTLTAGRLTEGAAGAGAAAAAARALPPAVERPQHVDQLAAIVRQHYPEESDFSRCLLPLLEACGWQGRGRDLAEAMPHMLRALDISGLCNVMANLDLLPRHFESSLARLDSRLMPCLFIPTDRPAMVVLARQDDGRLRCFDGGSGEERLIEPTSETAQVYVFRAPDSLHRPAQRPGSWFIGLAHRFRRHIGLAFALTIFSTLLALAPPLFVKSMYDYVLPSGDIPMQTYLLIGAAIALWLDFLLRRLKSRVIAHVGGRTEYILGTTLFSRVISLPATSTEAASVNRQVGRLRNFESLRDFFLGPLTIIVFDLPANLIVVTVVALINPWALAAVAVAAVAYFLLAWGTRSLSERAAARATRGSVERWEFLNETITQMRLIRSAGCRDIWMERFRQRSGKAVMNNYRSHQIQARVSGAAQVLNTVTGLTALAISAVGAIRGDLSGGAMIATMMLIWRITGPMQNFFLAATSLAHIRSSMAQIEKLMHLPGEHDGGVRQTIRPPFEGALSFTRVSFRYANDADPALLGVSFSIPPGKVVVFTGPNGSGKSTLLKLVARSFVPQAGTIRLDNLDIRQLPVADLRSRLSYMPQNCDLFYGTVTQNLRLAHPAATDAEVAWALEMTGLTEDVAALHQGLETRISNSRSEQLPNGFRQRLALARTLLKPAAVVMLDEPGNGLDDAGEEALLRCIEWLRGRSTLLIVSHRPGHMRLADTVVYMEHGAVAAIGPFDSIKDKLMSGIRK